MLFTPWLRSLKFPARLTRTARRRKRRFSPLFAIERLEDRTLLSVFAVNSVLDKVDLIPGDGIVDTGTPGEITLRAAIQEANALAGDDTITLGAGTFTLSITGTGEDAAATGDLDITDTTGSLTIIGAGADRTIIDAAGLDRVFEVFGAATLDLHDVTISGGKISPILATGLGGGIHNNKGGTVTIANSTLSGNRATFGGAIRNFGRMTITNSTLSGNNGTTGGAILNTGGSTLTITNSTLSGNSANEAGAIINAGALTLINSTLSANFAGFKGSAILSQSGTLTLENTIISGNRGAPDVWGNFNSLGYNIIGDVGSATGFMHGVNGDLVGGGGNPVIDALLGPLQDNGGTTFTHALLAGSPAIDAGNNSGVPATDQRGFPRIIDGDLDGTATIDIGAFEFVPPVTLVQIDIKPGSDPNSINLGSKGTIPVAIFSTPT